MCCRLLHNINNANFCDWLVCEETHHEIDGHVIYHQLISFTVPQRGEPGEGSESDFVAESKLDSDRE